MLNASLIVARISEAERYLSLVLQDYSAKWELYRHDAEARADVPLGLALIHPDNWIGQAAQQQVQGPRAFRASLIHATRVCNAPDYWGVVCTTDTLTEGAVADHAWPYGLGGATLVGNITWLCRRHNLIKGIDIHFYPWELGWPDWLSTQLDKIERVLYRAGSLS